MIQGHYSASTRLEFSQETGVREKLARDISFPNHISARGLASAACVCARILACLNLQQKPEISNLYLHSFQKGNSPSKANVLGGEHGQGGHFPALSWDLSPQEKLNLLGGTSMLGKNSKTSHFAGTQKSNKTDEIK